MRPHLLVMLAILGITDFASAQSSVGCHFQPALFCDAVGTCTRVESAPVSSVWLTDGTKTLSVCFPGNPERCLKAKGSVRESAEGDVVVSSIVQNNKNYGKISRKLLVTLVWGPFQHIQGRAVIYTTSEDREPHMYISLGDCQGAG